MSSSETSDLTVSRYEYGIRAYPRRACVGTAVAGVRAMSGGVATLPPIDSPNVDDEGTRTAWRTNALT